MGNIYIRSRNNVDGVEGLFFYIHLKQPADESEAFPGGGADFLISTQLLRKLAIFAAALIATRQLATNVASM